MISEHVLEETFNTCRPMFEHVTIGKAAKLCRLDYERLAVPSRRSRSRFRNFVGSHSFDSARWWIRSIGLRKAEGPIDQHPKQ